MVQSLLNGSSRVLYSVDEVAEMFGVCNKSVYRLIARGHLKASSALRHKRISRESIDAFIRTTTGGAR